MSKRAFLTAAVLAALCGSASVSLATPSPDGPYQKSCKKCSVNGKMGKAGKLFCTCNKKDGKANETSLLLDPNNKEPINNCDGNLQYGQCR